MDQHSIDYWLGRGRFRHFTIAGEFGDTTSDIDFHVWRASESALHESLQELRNLGYEITDCAARHKLAMRKDQVAIEFMYLDQVDSDPAICFHETVHPLRKRFLCPTQVFGDRRMEMFGTRVRVPAEEYLPCVFGPRWREDRKGTGGVEI